jgi:hypothetical protein
MLRVWWELQVDTELRRECMAMWRLGSLDAVRSQGVCVAVETRHKLA